MKRVQSLMSQNVSLDFRDKVISTLHNTDVSIFELLLAMGV